MTVSPEEIRLSALRYAEAVLQSRTTHSQGIVHTANITAEELVTSARVIESYIAGLD